MKGIYVELLLRLVRHMRIVKLEQPKQTVIHPHSTVKHYRPRIRKAWSQGIEFTETQAHELLGDWMIVPTPLRCQLIRSIYRFRESFTLSVIRADMNQRGYNMSAERLIEEMRPFLRRKLVLRMQARYNVRRYRLSSNRCVRNLVYARFFFKSRVNNLHDGRAIRSSLITHHQKKSRSPQ